MKPTRHFLPLILFITIQAWAGDHDLSLTQALHLASLNNRDIAMAEAETNQRRADRLKSYSVFLPQITLSETYVTTNDPLNVFGLKLKQESVTQSDFNPSLLNNPDRLENFSTKVEVRQPLVNVDGLFGRSAAGYGLRATQLKQKRTAAAVAFQVKMSYFRLSLARQSLEVVDKALVAARAGKSQAENYYKEGLANKSDVLFADVRLLELQNRRLETESAIRTATDQLAFLTGLDPAMEIIPIDSFHTNPIDIVPLEGESVNSSRSDMLAMKAGLDATRRLAGMAHSRFFPSLNAFGSYEWNDTRAFGHKGKNWMAGVMLKWDILTGFDQIGEIRKARSAVEHARLTYDQAAEKNRYDLKAAYRQLDISAKGMLIAGKAVQQAEENYRILTDRYNKGLDRITDWLAAEAALSQVRLQLLHSQFSYTAALFTIELLTEKSITR